LWAVKTLTNKYGSGTVSATVPYQQSLVAASLYVDYVFLDTDERRKMAQNPHEYLIEQVQFTGDESVGSSSNKIKLNFNHPCKELIWVVQPDANVDYCASLDNTQVLFKTLGAQPFNYTDAIDALPNAIHAFGGPAETASGSFIVSSGVFEMAGAMDGTATSNTLPTAGNPNWATNAATDIPFNAATSGMADQGSYVSDAGTFVLAETALDMHCWGENPVVTAKLQLNGQDRFSEREGSYFDVVQPFQHHTRAPDTGINVYSFALRPEEHQPSGSCNFSRIDNAVLQLVLSSGTVAGTATAKVRVYAVNYNVLRVMSGINRYFQLCQKTTRRKQTGSVCGNFGYAPVNMVACC
jgi:Large eukaryotic DNA virus major capsid protein